MPAPQVDFDSHVRETVDLKKGRVHNLSLEIQASFVSAGRNTEKIAELFIRESLHAMLPIRSQANEFI